MSMLQEIKSKMWHWTEVYAKVTGDAPDTLYLSIPAHYILRKELMNLNLQNPPDFLTAQVSIQKPYELYGMVVYVFLQLPSNCWVMRLRNNKIEGIY